MTNAATGHALNGKNRGWRKAVRFALTENSTSTSSPPPEARKSMLNIVAEDSV